MASLIASLKIIKKLKHYKQGKQKMYGKLNAKPLLVSKMEVL
jgi:hypothetical protein